MLHLVTVILCISLACLAVAYRKYVELNKKIKGYQKQKDENLLVDLELATVEQLFDELKKRTLTPFLVIRPESAGIQIDAHNINPVTSAHLLTAAAFIVQNELANRGIDFDGPKFSPPDQPWQ